MAAYLAMWADVVEARQTPDREPANLAAHAAGQALQLMSGAVLQDRQNGVVMHGQPEFAPRVTALTPADAPVAVSILDCADGTNWREYTTAGQPKDDKPGGKHRVVATIGLIEGGWKVTRLQVDGVGTCT